MIRVARYALTLLFVAGAACTREAGGNLDPLPITGSVSLVPGAFAVLSDAEAAGAVAFPEAGVGGAEYLVVGQFATGIPDLSTTVRLGGQSAAVPAGSASSVALRAEPDPAARFHRMLRARESSLAREAPKFRAQAGAARVARTPPPDPGSQRVFKVCGDIDCDDLANVTATARFVGQHAAIYVDNAAPAPGLSDADLLAMGNQFDTVLYDIGVTNFGSESDLDGNGVVIVLLSPRINALVGRPDCQNAFISGYFFAGDIAPGFATQYNNGEVFYGLVPDPAGSASCTRTVSEVRNILPVTFIHEFQHMISFNQHVLVRPGLDESLWINEGLSHLAEEITGRYYQTAGDNTLASRFLIGNLYNAYVYLRDAAQHPLVTEEPPGSLESRGASWLFLRYLVDRFGVATSANLVQTGNRGLTNLETVTGVPFEQLLAAWALTVYVDDLPNFTPPPVLTLASWNLRTTYASLNAQSPVDFDRPFPIVAATGSGADAEVIGPLLSGSGQYLRVTQGANGAAFAMTLRPATGGTLQANRGGQLAVIRLR